MLLDDKSTRMSYTALAVGKLMTLEPLIAEEKTLLAGLSADTLVSKIQIDMVLLEVVETENVRGPVTGGWMKPV